MAEPGSTADSLFLRRAVTWIAGASIVLVVVNGALVLRNQATQRVVNQRQVNVNQGTEAARVNQVLVEFIARAAIQRKDDALLALLERHGIRINQNPPPVPNGEAPPAAPEKTP